MHSEDLLRNPSFIKRAKSKGLVIFSWGDDANDPDNRKRLREYGVHGLIYDRYLNCVFKIIIMIKLRNYCILILVKFHIAFWLTGCRISSFCAVSTGSS